MNKSRKKPVTYRRTAQIVSFLLFTYIIWTMGTPLFGVLTPSLFFKFDPLVILVTIIAERVLLIGILFSAITLAVTFVFGRFFCGWLCPLGSLMDFFSWIPSGLLKKKPGENGPGSGRFVKFALLAGIFFLALFGVQLAWALDPITIFVRTFSFTLQPFINTSLEKFFITALEAFEYPFFLEKIYYGLKGSLLQITAHSFPHAKFIVIEFAVIVALLLFKRRFWCRYLCPLGALLAVASKKPLLQRVNGPCADTCPVCKNICRMGAIRQDNSYAPEECILCMDCIEKCPSQRSSFTFKNKPLPEQGSSAGHSGMSRAQFLVFLSSALSFLLCFDKRIKPSAQRPVVRPPGSINEKDFVQRCIRCGNCMKVCITNGLQPSFLESGIEGIWTPKFSFDIGYCEYNCRLCTQVCPTEAIAPLSLEKKKSFTLGTAFVDRTTCKPWAQGVECIVCEEHCPIPQKAIKVEEITVAGRKKIGAPVVDPALCIGCGICEHYCPVRPSAITVTPL